MTPPGSSPRMRRRISARAGRDTFGVPSQMILDEPLRTAYLMDSSNAVCHPALLPAHLKHSSTAPRVPGESANLTARTQRVTTGSGGVLSVLSASFGTVGGS